MEDLWTTPTLPVREHVRAEVVGVCDMFESPHPRITFILAESYKGNKH